MLNIPIAADYEIISKSKPKKKPNKKQISFWNKK